MLLVVYMLIICLCVFVLLYHPVMNLTFLPLTNFHVIDLFSEDVCFTWLQGLLQTCDLELEVYLYLQPLSL